MLNRKYICRICLLWLLNVAFGFVPVSADASPVSDSETSAPDQSAMLLKLQAELEAKDKELANTQHANEEMHKEKLLEEHKIKEQLVQSKLSEQSARHELKLQLQNKLLETEEQLQVDQATIKGEVKVLKQETTDLIKAHVLNETATTPGVTDTVSEEEDAEEGINQLGNLVKESEHQKATHTHTTLNQTLQETHGQLTTVVKLPGKLKNSKDDVASNKTEASDPAGRLIDSDHNEYVLVKSGTDSAATDKTLMKDLVVVLVAASITALGARLIGIPTLLGYILAGSIVGPSMLSFIESFVQVETLAQLGINFLLYALGLEMSFNKLRAVWKIAMVGGGLSMFVQVMLVMSFASHQGISLAQGLFVGCFVSMSSTAVVLKCLESSGKNGTPSGDAMVGILIFQDIALGVMLAVLQSSGKQLRPNPAFVAIVSLTLMGAVAAVIGKLFVGRFIDLLVRLESKETFIMCILAICLLASAGTEHMGFSTEIGAFIAGVVVSSHTHHTEKILDSLEPVRDIFAALFFTSIGVHVDVVFLVYNSTLILSLLAAVFCLKATITAVCVKMCGYPTSLAVEVGIGLAQIGEFAFVLASNAKASGMIKGQVHQLLVHTTVIGLLLTPLVLKLVPPLMARVFAPPSLAEATVAREQKGSSTSALHSL